MKFLEVSNYEYTGDIPLNARRTIERIRKMHDWNRMGGKNADDLRA